MVLHSHAPDWTYEETKEILLCIPTKWVKELSIILYVLGARLNEARNLRPKDIHLKKTENGTRLLVELPTEKNPRIERRNIPVNPTTEKEYFETIIEYKYENYPEEYALKKYSEEWYRKKLRIILDIHPHALRHLRVHHIDDKSVPGLQHLTPRQYQDYFGWETIGTSSRYQSRTRSRDLMNQF